MKIIDPNWRVEHLYKIVNKSGQRITFKRNYPQKLLNNIKQKRKMILKSRQIGFSTDCLITKFDRTIFNENITTAILAHDKESVEKLFRIVARAYKYMPNEFKPQIDRGGGSRNEMFFPEINSRIYCDLEIRGDTVQQLHISEAAFMKDSSKIKATLQAVPLNGTVTLETTPNGMGNYFYEMWNDVDQPYAKFFVPWYMFPEYRLQVSSPLEYTDEENELIKKAKKLFNIDITQEQIAFRRLKKAELKDSPSDKIKVPFEQEYPEDDISCFLASGSSVLDLFILKELLDQAPDPISDNGWKVIYKSPQKGRTYVVGADVAEGTGRDFSTAVVIDTKTMEVVATIRGHWKPFEFAHKLKDLCEEYSSPNNEKPLLSVERNNHGHAVLLELSEHINYGNLYIHSDDKLGWRTDLVTRPIMINTFINAVENKYLTINDRSIFSECFTLINKDGKIQAADGKNDDMIVATSIALQMCLKASNLDVYEDIEKKILL